jgi:hypothetical protein
MTTRRASASSLRLVRTGCESCHDANAAPRRGLLRPTRRHVHLPRGGCRLRGRRHALRARTAIRADLSQKLREFARGEYAGELAEIKRRTGLDAAEWLDGAVPLADRIDRWAAEDRDDAIALADDLQARAAYAVLSITYSDGWDARDVSDLWGALGSFSDSVRRRQTNYLHRSWVVATSTPLSARVREALHRTK